MKIENRALTVAIDAAVQRIGGEPGHEDKEVRGHLGASLIGKDCHRELWYDFRWVSPSAFEGRMLRLFATGFKYEARFIKLLELVGATVEEYDPASFHSLLYHDGSDSYVVLAPGERQGEPSSALDVVDDVTDIPWHVLRAADRGVVLPKRKQYRFKDVTGHFAGSLDGIATNVPGMELLGLAKDVPVLVEFKTHKLKSFLALKDLGVHAAKPRHADQMITYMEAKKLPAALYVAVCKDTDELWFEWVLPQTSRAHELLLKAQSIIAAQFPPARISKTPTWFGCKFCDHRLICHYGQPMARNCRTCRFATPVAEGQWACQMWKANIPLEAQQVGCQRYLAIPNN